MTRLGALALLVLAASSYAHVVAFPNFLIGGHSHSTIYVAITAADQ